MIYTRAQFGKELKEKVAKQQNIIEIGVWSFSTYWKHMEDMDFDFQDIALTLNTMELGPEFAFTYEELDIIADDLIAGREVKLR